jgi:hypothetical protein
MTSKMYHTFECHNFHIKRYHHCPYCDCGSIPKHKKEIEEMTKGHITWHIGIPGNRLEVRK